MAASLSVNALQVNFESVLSMEHAGILKMFKTLEESGVKGFLGVQCSIYKGAVIEFFTNAKVITGTIAIFVANRKMVITKDVFATTIQLHIEGLVGFTDISVKAVSEMKIRFSGTDVDFQPPNKKKEMKVEYRMLHDIVAKELCAEASSFDVVTSEKFDLMVDISAGLQVNWGHILFQTLVSMVYIPNRQSQGFAVQLCILLEKVVKSNLGEFVKLHPLKELNQKSVLIYMRKNKAVIPVGESSTQSGEIASENKFTAGGLQSVTNKPEEAIEKKNEKAAETKKKETVVVVKNPVVAGSQSAPEKSKFGTSSDEDSSPLSKLGAAVRSESIIIYLEN
ncbi:hypothetical protein F511_09271 [Dorcoceras hygrometricum]|uniref:Uncharacterized protein n=1 Tax=Dorcoceras hygrometricum TaxID=472368 RepID=A0A2Z7BJE2_9LAMI|nr:hypothetical protein F511_09271 [Dorcoceras hygrometricum]